MDSFGAGDCLCRRVGYFIYDHHRKLENITQDEATSQKQIGDLTKRVQAAEADSETLAHQLGMTKKELATRTPNYSVSNNLHPHALQPRPLNRRKM